MGHVVGGGFDEPDVDHSGCHRATVGRAGDTTVGSLDRFSRAAVRSGGGTVVDSPAAYGTPGESEAHPEALRVGTRGRRVVDAHEGPASSVPSVQSRDDRREAAQRLLRRLLDAVTQQQVRALRGGGKFRELPELKVERAALVRRDPGSAAELIGLIVRLEGSVGLVRREVTYPLATAPEVGELKIARHRLYFCEPPSVSDLVLGLSLATKLRHLHPDINTAQNRDIAVAAGRHTAWQSAGSVPPAPWP